MFIAHLSLECYPIAKVGGLGDVVGALPKYLNRNDEQAIVVLPKYKNQWMKDKKTETVFSGCLTLDEESFKYSIERLKGDEISFPVYLINIPGLWDRPGIYADPTTQYAYWDTLQRYIGFQTAALQWFQSMEQKPDVIHCHDHHTAFVPFITTRCKEFESLKHIPTVLTIHNGEYHGEYDFKEARMLPDFPWSESGLLDWHGKMNALATGIKTAWKVTTVSESYMQELQYHSNGLEALLTKEEGKCQGIINGIDTETWDPNTDPYVAKTFNRRNYISGKKENKHHLMQTLGQDDETMVISFIGRLVREKGADLLPDLITQLVDHYHDIQFVILGTGEKTIEDRLRTLANDQIDQVRVVLEYNEKLAHQIYAGSDFLLMPSRVEPCGLNQMYALRYGTIPIVRAVGGLKDSIVDVGEAEEGYGIRFYDFNIPESFEAVKRARKLFNDKKTFKTVIKRSMALDFSWNSSALNYIQLYKSL